ncbi:class I SAM-dependent methyltransferase [Shewanella gelidimarina]|uniref:class I SAM-dependent methyltransferase n=1 Tax=Shewanella gelidimarina TaxID=56813 RepID=UPI00200D5CB5|nr:class I SAM-dependent methyltransferase [Shewanella gelidimarina]MCL1056377.1 class I SAM-dependent methyltransferase [Shewanella gelidimarina]
MRRCPLCLSSNSQLFYENKKRCLYRCHQCELVFADANSHLPPNAELQKYRLANNKHKLLSQFLFDLVSQCETSGQSLLGLNFGRTLDPKSLQRVTEHGHIINQYDPSLAPWNRQLKQQYDFICCYRVFEHFRFPYKEWRLLCELVKPGGWIAINTPLLTDLDGFDKWHHKNNITHVSFYQQQSFKYLANNAGFKLLFAANDLILVQKPSGSGITRGQTSIVDRDY